MHTVLICRIIIFSTTVSAPIVVVAAFSFFSSCLTFVRFGGVSKGHELQSMPMRYRQCLHTMCSSNFVSNCFMNVASLMTKVTSSREVVVPDRVGQLFDEVRAVGKDGRVVDISIFINAAIFRIADRRSAIISS